MIKYTTYEIYKCSDCDSVITIPKHSKDVLPEGHKWKRSIKREKEEGTVNDPLKTA